MMLEIQNNKKRLTFLKLMGILYCVRTHMDLTARKEYSYFKFYFDEIYTCALAAPVLFYLDPAERPSDYW